MNKTALRTGVLLAVLAAATATTAIAPAASATEAPAAPAAAVATTTASIKGAARMEFPAPGNDIRVTVDAHGTYTSKSPIFPTKSSGTFRISHKIDQPNGKKPLVFWGDFTVDCLTTGGPNATVTGRLVRTSPGHPWRKELDPHTRMGVSFHVAGKDGGPSRIGLSGATKKGEPLLTKCMAPAPDAKVVEGGYVLTDKGPLSQDGRK
ncbi:hypothetical protein [Streptomyces triculaminicus]|uniref:hypothetical protein n=1 Tax=Streptomyces triculaminicus TaxID=2816232 RepID=UPI0037CF766A